METLQFLILRFFRLLMLANADKAMTAEIMAAAKMRISAILTTRLTKSSRLSDTWPCQFLAFGFLRISINNTRFSVVPIVDLHLVTC